jgi:NAD(P)-dependent dehydrogenase (short-subunit alcohol dehydrogenase family)
MEPDRLNAVALITGAGYGIGAACARDIGKRADGGLILIDADEGALAATADDLELRGAFPERVSTLAFDAADAARWAQAAEFIKAQYGRLDWALVNAGVTSTILAGALLTLRSVMPLMRGNARGGAVVVTAAAALLKAESGIAAYGAAKSGLLQLMRVAAKEGAPDNIRVNAIVSGGVETPMLRKAPMFQDLVRQKGGERAAFDAIAKQATPLARYAGADDIARLTLMLLSDESAITGATLVVDGGYTL